MDKLKVFITGASGFLGKALVYYGSGKYQLYGTFLNHKVSYSSGIVSLFKIDITQSRELEELIVSVHPDVIVHAAALTDVDFCEINKPIAYKVNVNGTINVLRAAEIVRAKLVYVSTDFVFDGSKGNYLEDDHKNPLNYYGYTKSLAEDFVLRYYKSLVVRTSMFGFNPGGAKPGLDRIIDELNSGKQFYTPYDSFFSPLSVNTLSSILYQILDYNFNGEIYHIAGEKISKFDFFTKIAKAFRANEKEIIPIEFEKYQKARIADRPKDSSLYAGKLHRNFGISPILLKHEISKLINVKEKYISFFGGANACKNS